MLKRNRSKACINCAYLSFKDTEDGETHNYISATKEQRIPKETDCLIGSQCFHKQWTGLAEPLDISAKNSLSFAREQNFREQIILDSREKPLILSTHYCGDYFPYEELGSRTLKECWKEQQKRKELIKFWMSIVIVILFLALAIVYIRPRKTA